MAGAAGAPDPTGRYPAELISGRILVQLEAFDAALCERHGAVQMAASALFRAVAAFGKDEGAALIGFVG